MFFEYLYLDTDKVRQFTVLMEGANSQSNNLERKKGNNLGLKVNTGIIQASYSNNSEVKSEPTIDEYSLFSNFQEKLVKEKNKQSEHFIDTDDFLNFDYIEKLKRGKILKFDGELKIPEEFGEIEFINNLLKNEGAKSALMNSIDIKNQDERQIFNLFFGRNKDTKIPVYFEVDDYILYGVLENKYLKIDDYSDFENLQNQEVTIYAKIEKIDPVNREFEVIDVYKDVLGMNRAMRRGTNTNTNANANANANKTNSGSAFAESIILKGKSIKVSFIALLK